jgi:transglutaminase-like putative cysteine protease
LSKGSLFALLGALLAVAAPHAQRQPVWISAFVIALIGWRVLLALRDASAPPRWLLIILALLSVAGVILSFGPLLGRDASVGLLAVMAALKCLELRTPRDAQVVGCLGYFLIITNFLYSQTIPSAAFMLAVLAWLTATLVSLQDRGKRLSPVASLRTAGTLMVQAVPLMLVLFLLFPRVQGPIFGFPQATSAGVTGLSDTMSPGDLANLGLSDEVAFRVEFQTSAPKPSALYWRGPVLWDFDGRTWTMGVPASTANPRHEVTAPPLRYTVTLEPHHLRWLFAIDLPGSVPPDALVTGDYQLLAQRPVRVRQRYEMTSHLGYRLGMDETPEVLRRALRLPRGYNPRALELAQSLRARSASDAEVVNRTLSMFRNQLFFYTLVPPELGRHSVDEFLFDTRRGFCEHYASAFTFLMRAAGVPARVVTGYQGGVLNPLGDYLIVRQSEAHAWSEVWLPGAGWVRIDPTGAVSPARIEVGIAAAVPQGDPLPITVRGQFRFLNQLRDSLDAFTNSWNQWVLGYTPDRQVKLLRGVGMGAPTWQNLTLAMMFAAGVVVLVLSAIVLSRLRSRLCDPVQRAYRSFTRKLARAGLPRGPAEGPLDFARRVSVAQPPLAAAVQAITALYLSLRYGGAPPQHAEQLRVLVRRFHPRARRFRPAR